MNGGEQSWEKEKAVIMSDDTNNPQLSVVIASLNGKPYLEACLAGLARQQGDIVVEVIVADCVGSEVVTFVEREHPDVILIPFDTPKSVPQLRAAGILKSTGNIVVITEDHCIPSDDWYVSLVESHQTHDNLAIGGAVDNAATERQIDWAVYFCEYSNFLSPVPNGIVHDLPGPNVSYKREAVSLMEDMLEDGYWENFLHQRLEENGHMLRSDSSVQVYHKKHFTWGDFLSERFHYGRWYAGTRNQFTSLPKRLFYLAFSPALPPLILYRLYQRVSQRGDDEHMSEFMRSLPYIMVFTLAWAAGEFAGYATGPGDSVMALR